ncbi:tetratricopeptide repeat protein [Aurantiacibacter sp. MUD61]|uniref:tetratricopeptide repeat protein n=1 Tax=Aurantiacibacter sp. MUD61 TaxID=3009083 RepID=UPI0022F13D7A|nr:tetratricopeptide repeat protein [Aurantiacibacter sp. MUD61]
MKIISRPAIACLAALSLAACGLSPEERLDRAEEAFAENRFNEARLDLASVLQEDANNVAALQLLARTQLQAGDGEGAYSSLQRLDELSARPADYDQMLAEAQLLRGNFEAAIGSAEALASAEGARIIALSHIGLGEGREAQSAFEAGLTMSGDRSRLLADYAIFMLQAGDAEAAHRLATQALEANENGLDPLLANARIVMARGDMNRALGFYTTAAEEWPENRLAILGRIGVLGDLGRLEEARPLIADLADRLPGDPDVIYLQARLAAEDGDWEDVRAILQPVEGRDQAQQQLLYARALLELDLPEQAMPRLTSLLRSAPGDPEARRLLARAQLETNEPAAAFATIRPLAASALGTSQDLAIFAASARASGRSAGIDDALAAAPPSERLGLLLAQGDSALQRENWRAAIDAYEELRRWTGDRNALVLNNLAFARGRTGDTAEAIRLGEMAHELAPEHPSIMDTLGWLLVESGEDRSRGLLLLERAAQLDPDNPTINRHLSEARGG